MLRAYLSGILPSATQKLRACYTLLLRTAHPDIYPDIPGNYPADPEYSERGRGLQNDPITFPDETDSLARTVQPAELVIPAQQSVSYFLPARTLQPSPSDLLFTLPTLFLLLDLYSLLALFSSLNTMHYLLSLHSLTGLPAMLDLTTLFLLPDFYSLQLPSPLPTTCTLCSPYTT